MYLIIPKGKTLGNNGILTLGHSPERVKTDTVSRVEGSIRTFILKVKSILLGQHNIQLFKAVPFLFPRKQLNCSREDFIGLIVLL